MKQDDFNKCWCDGCINRAKRWWYLSIGLDAINWVAEPDIHFINHIVPHCKEHYYEHEDVMKAKGYRPTRSLATARALLLMSK